MILPMKYFTPKEMQPSEQTLRIIRQVGRLYQAASGKANVYKTCMN